MNTLSELYDFLEDKRDDKHIDGILSYDASLPEEWQKARLEILTWWKIERIVKDENCHIDRSFAVAYFEERANVTNNKLLKYRITTSPICCLIMTIVSQNILLML